MRRLLDLTFFLSFPRTDDRYSAFGPFGTLCIINIPPPHETPLHWLGVSSYPLILRKSTCILVDVEVVVCLLPRLIYTFFDLL